MRSSDRSLAPAHRSRCLDSAPSPKSRTRRCRSRTASQDRAPRAAGSTNSVPAGAPAAGCAAPPRARLYKSKGMFVLRAEHPEGPAPPRTAHRVRFHFIHSSVTRFAMRNVNTYHRSTLAAPISRAVRSTGSAKATYTASGTVVPMATRRAILLARRWSSRVQLAHSPPIAMPAVSVPHWAHGWLGPNPLNHGAGEFGRSSTSPQVRCANLVLYDGCLEGAAQPPGGLELTDVIEHHRGGEQLRRRIGDPLPRDVRRRAVHRLEDRGVGTDVGPGREAQTADQSRRFV